MKPPTRHGHKACFGVMCIGKIINQNIQIKVFVAEINLLIQRIVTSQVNPFRISVYQLIAKIFEKLNIQLRHQLMPQIL